MDDIKLLIDIIGWIGALSLLMAYLLISSGKLEAKTYFYQNLNLLGSFCLIANTFYYGTMALVFLNSIWALIGINSLKNIILRKH
tara:strand:+ start:319898 stop:320152 length:255 start_codon:yes stop_codon:yes gene_type:complete